MAIASQDSAVPLLIRGGGASAVPFEEGTLLALHVGMSATSRPIDHAPPRRPLAAAVCQPGETCWVRGPARRVAFLVDAEAYYSALYDTLLRARERVWIIGWDVQAKTCLRPGAPRPAPRGAPPTELGPFLDFLARRNRRLRIHVLEWDYSVLFARERGLAPWIDLDWRTHPRVRFQLDDEHPFGACLHEKIVVVDDAVAFVGGLDLTLRRWDTPEHRPGHPLRVDPSGAPYDPFHDVQMMVEGEIVRPLAERIRRRWNEVGEARVRPLPGAALDVWPPSVRPDVERVPVAIARTEPGASGEGVREIESLHLASIRAARRSIYLENQYFSAESIASALCERLAEPEGPEVVVVLPSACSGWLEEQTMGARRARILARLREADRFDRFRAYAPTAPDVGRVNVHAKLAIVDDALVRIGSANLANRSLGFDRECDLALEAEGRADVAAAIAGLRTRLVSEHLGLAPEDFDDAYARHDRSLIATIDALRGAPRTLAPVEACDAGATWLALPIDPLEPSSFVEPLARWTPPELRDPHRRALLLGLLVGLGVAFALLLASPFVPTLELADLAATLRRMPPELGGPITALSIALGVQLFLPVTALGALAILALGPLEGVLWTSVGAVVGASLGWVLGRFWIGQRVERLAPGGVAAFRRRLRGRGMRAIALARLAPRLPFSVGNFAAGAARVRLAPFLGGTALALLPGLGAVAGVLDSAQAAWRDPTPVRVLGAAGAIALAVLVAGWLRRWAGTRARP